MTGDPVDRVTAGFTEARRVADALLFEGYVLYPYRASARKNQLRWQFGVLVPPAWQDAGGEHTWQRTECLLEPRRADRLLVELRFLQVRRRSVERLSPDGESWTEVAELDLPDRVLVPWDEGEEERVELDVPLDRLAGEGHTLRFELPGGVEHEPVHDGAGGVVGRLVRHSRPLTGEIRLTTEPLPGPYGALRLTATVRNVSAWTPGPGERDDRESALPHSLIGAHLLLGLPGGRFLSMADPPEWARPAARTCHSEHTWPVLACGAGRDEVMLSSPIILDDHPEVAAESPGPLYDATEIDEILSLRTAALTEREKREARGTDARAAEVIDLVDGMPAEVWERLHGAIRGLREVTGELTGGRAGRTSAGDVTGGPLPGDPGIDLTVVPPYAEPPAAGLRLPTGPGLPWWDPAQDATSAPGRGTVTLDGQVLGTGSRVVLKPGLRRSDAQDIFLAGRTATVEAVLEDFDGETHIAVTVDGDPGTDVRREQGRFLYFRPDEVDPVPEPGRAPARDGEGGV
ncbi:hypothetical protein OG949_38410 [Streptomyces scopuliridis]|uniref:hypothetical protein n=1 Tax=Streptomyces scopuliridis TaxID=452529 RepID=UPI002DDBFBE5|nr:hypothetical protein [Streptomyces scopuliridis]WSB38122.1 hypothetical protein OG949_38410 [Streptomyces scopuliridis]